MDVPVCRSSRMCGILRSESRILALRPTGPPPMIATGCTVWVDVDDIFKSDAVPSLATEVSSWGTRYLTESEI